MKTTLKKLLEKKDWYYINNDITDQNFPLPEKIETKNWKIITLDKAMTSNEILAEIKKQGCRPANCWELLMWANNHREEVPKGKWYIGLGQLWYDGGHRRVPYVRAHSGGDFEFVLGYFEDGWDDDDCLLCFCDEKIKPLDTLTPGNDSDYLTLSEQIRFLEQRVKKLESLVNP